MTIVSQFTQEPAQDRLATADLEKLGRGPDLGEDGFDRPRALNIFQVAIPPGDLGKLVDALAKSRTVA